MSRVADELVDAQTVRTNTARPSWYSEVDTGQLTIPEADTVIRRTGALSMSLGAVDIRTSDQGLTVGGLLPMDTRTAVSVREGVSGPITPVAIAGVLIALGLVAGAGSFWMDKRLPEVRLLASRGVSPVLLGLRAPLEMIFPLLVGAICGWAAAIGLVLAVGPSPRLEPGSGSQALAIAGTALLAAFAVLIVVSGWRARLLTDRRVAIKSAGWLRLPIEVTLLLLAAWTYVSLRRNGAIVVGQQDVVRVSPLLITFPLLAIAGTLTLVVRGLSLMLPFVRRIGTHWRSPNYLAVRSLTALVLPTAAVLVMTGLPVAVLIFSTSATQTMSSAVNSKAGLYAGAQAALVLRVPPAEPLQLQGNGTPVSVIIGAKTAADDNTVVLGIDPDTFAQFAFSGGSLFDESLLSDLSSRSAVSEPGASVPAIVVACQPCPPVDRVSIRSTSLPVQTVAELPLFPGLRTPGRPVLVVPRGALDNVDHYANRSEEAWTTSDRLPALLDTLAEQRIEVGRQVTPDKFLNATDLLPVAWTFGYLEALATLTGVIAVVGLLLYLAARQRARLAAYVLLRKMGLSRLGHFWSLLVELWSLLLTGWGLGVAVASGTALLVYRRLDVNPEFLPPAILRLPIFLIVISLAELAVVALVAAASTQRTADRASPSAIMRGNK